MDTIKVTKKLQNWLDQCKIQVNTAVLNLTATQQWKENNFHGHHLSSFQVVYDSLRSRCPMIDNNLFM